MNEDLANWLRQCFAHLWGSEEGSERRAIVAESQESGTRVARGEDERSLLRMEQEDPEGWRLEGQEAGGRQEGREAAGPGQGPQVEEPRPQLAGWRGGEQEGAGARPERQEPWEMAVPEGGAPAGPEVGLQRMGRGKSDRVQRRRLASRSGKDPKRQGRPRDWYWEAYLERAQKRYRERSVKRRVKGEESESPDEAEWTFPLERKAKLHSIPRAEEKGDSDGETSGIFKVPKQQSRRPKIRFSLAPKLSRRWSQWSATGTRPRSSVINELAKMGDPDLLEMVEQEAHGPRGTLAALPPENRGRSQSGEPCARQTAVQTFRA
ncbi:hypothetical protein SUZIE_161665 [Sciurus carolinensis]|uniref:Uncharacterized protein n=1 Tax=Sciurus carolinensis TaxID=30640 RepID=A0AA41MZT4_SCICA|nr:hypothetical protein [Sciurus carolinensis]